MAARLPNALIIGAQKAGTTALHSYLSEHPEIFASAEKEPHFFSHNHGRPRDIDAYCTLFEGAEGFPIVLESSTTYTMFPTAHGTTARIREHLGDVKLIYLLRDPIERMRSGYAHAVSTGAESRPIGLALTQDTRYLFPSLYATQIERYLAEFPIENLLCLRHEDFRLDPGPTLDQVLAFLGLATGWRPHQIQRTFNVTSTRRAPRRWWRRAGGIMRRRGWTWAYPLVRRVPQDSGLTSRRIDSAEVVIPEEVLECMLVLIRKDLERLRELLGPGWEWGYLD